MMEFETLHENDYLAFIQLEEGFRKQLDIDLAEQDSAFTFDYLVLNYMSMTLAAADEIGIEDLQGFRIPFEKNEIGDSYYRFRREVDSVKVRFKIRHSRQLKEMSVGLSEDQKKKIHALIEKIRSAVEASSASQDKKDKLYEIIAKLSKEVSKSRTGFERFTDLARGLAGLSKEVEEEGARPWWKWFALAVGVVDEAKEEEPRLPKPEEVKRIEPPKKQISNRNRPDMDDDIPF